MENILPPWPVSCSPICSDPRTSWNHLSEYTYCILLVLNAGYIIVSSALRKGTWFSDTVLLGKLTFMH